MGQEASVPAAENEEDPDLLEEQARAPPSSVNPPPPLEPHSSELIIGSGAGGGGGHGGPSAGSNVSASAQAATAKLTSMFRGSGGIGDGQQSHPSSNMNGGASGPISNHFDSYGDHESARAAAGGGQMYYDSGGNGDGTNNGGMVHSTSSGSVVIDAPGITYGQDEIPIVPSYDYVVPSHSSHTEDGNDEDGYYSATSSATGDNDGPSSLRPTATHPLQQQQTASAMSSSTGTGGGGSGSKRSLMMNMNLGGGGGGGGSGRALAAQQARAGGAAFINSMRHLNLGQAIKSKANKAAESIKQRGPGSSIRQHQHQQQHPPAAAGAANDWERQWDEDEGESSSDEESDDEGGGRVSGITSGRAVGEPSNSRIMLQPEHQSRLMQQVHQQQAMQQQSMPQLPYHHNQQQLSYEQIAAQTAVAEDLLSKPLHITAPNAAAVMAAASASTTAAATSSSISSSMMPLHHQQHLVSASDESMSSSLNDLNWEVQQQQAIIEEDPNKPNVQMFMPMLRVLGKGSFGKVVLVQKRVGKERGQLFAMKILKKTHLVKRRQIERTRTERKVLSVVNHPFIMKLHYAFQSIDKLYLVLDYCPGGELFFHLSRFRRFPERVARFYAAELLLAIGHLHKRGIIYRDLKPENVLLDADGHVKLGDFGLAKSGITHPFEGAASMCGTPEYMAPEVLAQSGHGFAVDYWGLGMLSYEMMTGLPPWYTTDRARLFRRLKSAPLDIPSYFSNGAADCVASLLERNPRRRLGVTGIRSAMEHEFFHSISWRSLYARRVEAPIQPCEGWKPPQPEDSNNNGYPANSSGGGGGVFRVGQHNSSSGSGASTTGTGDIQKMPSHELDTAVRNFDSNFTRMPVESEDQCANAVLSEEDRAAEEELQEDTFLGFSFDSSGKELAALAASGGSQQQQRPVHTNQPQQQYRQRTSAANHLQHQQHQQQRQNLQYQMSQQQQQQQYQYAQQHHQQQPPME